MLYSVFCKTVIMFKRLFNLCFFLLVSLSVSANHLLGGSITYQYISSASDSITYSISVKLYRECLAKKTGFDPLLKLGIYYNDAKKNLYTVEEIPIVS